MKYPRGRASLEPVAALIIAMIMGLANVVMIAVSVVLIVTDKVRVCVCRVEC